MKTTGNTILITGGASGIGLSLAEAFLAANNTVIICGRREDKLREAQARLPQLHIRQADLTDSDQRKALAESMLKDFPELNILVNNAGIQRECRVEAPDAAETFLTENEIEPNLTAPIHLTLLLLPQLRGQKQAAVVNITSGLALVPVAVMPVYSATKAALRSFTLSLRVQLASSSIRVFEVLPPIVDTDLDKGARKARGQKVDAISSQVVAQVVMAGMAADTLEIAVGRVRLLRRMVRLIPGKMLQIMNKSLR